MSRRLLGAATAATVLILSMAACSLFEREEPDPEMIDIPWTPTEGADVVCGMEPESVATATGLAVGRVEGDLTVQAGVGTGECAIWPEEESLVNGPMLRVLLAPAISAHAVEQREKLDGVGNRPPDVVYESLHGGAWGEVRPERGRMTSGAVSSVFLGDTLIELITTRGGVDRNPAADLQALTRQVASSHGLADGASS